MKLNLQLRLFISMWNVLSSRKMSIIVGVIIHFSTGRSVGCHPKTPTPKHAQHRSRSITQSHFQPQHQSQLLSAPHEYKLDGLFQHQQKHQSRERKHNTTQFLTNTKTYSYPPQCHGPVCPPTQSIPKPKNRQKRKRKNNPILISMPIPIYFENLNYFHQ